MNQEQQPQSEETQPQPESNGTHSKPSPFTPLDATPAAGHDEYATPGWSWGAFTLGPMFLIGIRKYSYLWLYLLMFIPLAMFGIMIWLGLKGREMAAESPTFTNRDQYVGYMKGIDFGGKVLFFVSLAVLALWLLFFVTMFDSFMSNQWHM